MSLEAALLANTEALTRLTNVLQSAGIPVPGTVELVAETTKRTRKPKDTPAADTSGTQAGSPTSTTDNSASTSTAAAVNDGKVLSIKLRSGDPEGTRYFHIAAHNTVAAVKPGEPIPSIAGMAEIDGGEYDTLKAKYASTLVPSEGNVAAGTSSAVPATSAAETASPAAQTSSQPTIDGPAVMEAFKKLHARDGNDGLRKALDELGTQLGVKIGRVGDLVADSSKHAAAFAFVNALLNPTAAPADLF